MYFLGPNRVTILHRGHFTYAKIDEDARNDYYRVTPKQTCSATIRQAKQEIAIGFDRLSELSSGDHPIDHDIREEYFPGRDEDGGKSHGGQKLEIALRMKRLAQILSCDPVTKFQF